MNGWNIMELGLLESIRDIFGCPALDWLMPKMTLFGEAGIFWIAVAVLFLCFAKTRKTGLMMGIAFLIGFLAGNMLIKNVVARIRPYDLPGVEISLLVNKLKDFSFPSGHTLVCFEAATVLLVRKRWWIGSLSLLLAFGVAFSRLYLFVHYPTDVLAGIMLGTAFGLLGVFFGGRLYDFLAKQIQKRRSASKGEQPPADAN